MDILDLEPLLKAGSCGGLMGCASVELFLNVTLCLLRSVIGRQCPGTGGWDVAGMGGGYIE